MSCVPPPSPSRTTSTATNHDTTLSSLGGTCSYHIISYHITQHSTTRQLLPEYMKDAGYTSHMVGKWHLGGHTFDHMPHRRGFETHLGYTYGAETYWTHEVNKTPTDPPRRRCRTCSCRSVVCNPGTYIMISGYI